MVEPVDSGTHPSLLLRLRDPADTASWRTFVDTYGPLLYHYCRRRGLQDADAADVAQEALIEVVRSIRTFEYRPECGRFRDWLGTLVFRRLVRFFERNQRRETPTNPDTLAASLPPLAAEGVESEWTDWFNAQLLQTALKRIRGHFEPATWRAFERVWIDNCPARQAADELGMAVESVYLAKSRVLKRLEQEIRMLAEDAPILASRP